MWLAIAFGTVSVLFSAYHLPVSQRDLRFLLLTLITLGIGSRITIQIPRVKGHISVSDTFVFLAMLLFGGEAAVLLAAAEALCSSSRFSKKVRTVLFNTAVMAFSYFFTAWVLHFIFGSIVELASGGYSPPFIAAVSIMALVQYVVNSGIIATVGALKTNQPIWLTWRENYLWTSITYFAGASAAGIIAKIIGAVGFYAFIVTAPIIAIVYFTYRTYLKNVEASAAQAEQAERHVEELSHYIAEQDRIRAQFTQIEKMSALGELASGVAHDFNNTLAGILGRAQLLMRTNDPEKIKKGLQIIIKTAEDGAKTVKRIQDFARQRRDHDFAPVAVDHLLLDVGEMTRPRWKDRAEAANVHISLDLQIHSNALIMGDESELREVLVNMVFNAVDAMPNGGTLTLSTEEDEDSVAICIKDTGAGMTAEVRSRIFDPFFTTKGKAGLGLGLAVSYGIIRRHEGTVEVESEVGRGTTFTIKLPIAKGTTKPQNESEQSAAVPLTLVPPANQTRILVVDDEEHVRELLRDILSSEGCDVVLAAGGSEALALFDAGKFDAVFTDVGMPGMSGWELSHAIRERNKCIPVAVITGWGEAVGSNEQKEAQIDWVVTKPFTISRIAELAKEVSQRRLDTATREPFTAAA